MPRFGCYSISIPPELSSCQACISSLCAQKRWSRHVGERRTIGRRLTAELSTVAVSGQFLWQEISKIFQSCPDIVGRDVIFSLDVLKRHSAGKTPHDNCDGDSRTANYWLAAKDGGIKDDPILNVQCSNVLCGPELKFICNGTPPQLRIPRLSSRYITRPFQL